MPSQFFGLNIAYTGLLSANAGLNTTSNNISNAETEGYSRQKVNQEANPAIRTYTTYGCAGAGVDVMSIDRIHDDFYDGKYWNNNTHTGEYSMKEYYMLQIEDYFKDDDTIKGFSSTFSEMMTALAEVKKNPASDVTKAQFIGFANNLTEYFNSMANSVEQVQKDVNLEVKIKIDEINSIASEIATLNKQINVIEISGIPANELRDKRTLLVDELSKIIDIDVNEYKIVDSNNPERETGGTQFIVNIAGGQTLVDTDVYRNLTCIARTNSEKVNQSDIDGLFDVYWITNTITGEVGEQFNLYNKLLGGELQGLIQMRDGNNKEGFAGIITDEGVGEVVSGKQHVKVKVDPNVEYLTDLNKCTLPENGGKITLANQVYCFDSWSYEYDGTDYYYDFVIDVAKSGEAVTSGKNGKEAAVGQALNYQGVPYYQQQLNEWVRIFANAFNSILKEGYSSEGDTGIGLFTGNKNTDDDQLAFGTEYKDGLGQNITAKVDVSDDSYYRLTAKNFSIATVFLSNASLLATKTDKGAGVDDYSNVAKLISMTTNPKIASYRGAATAEFLTCVLSDVALNSNSAQTFKTNYENIGKSINNQRVSISGVDTDEEVANLVKFQNAYTLASKMIQTLTEVYDRLILETGV